ncbi:TPA: hypothetical protein ACH3X1_008464 [Trebouxia sp. C0004]
MEGAAMLKLLHLLHEEDASRCSKALLALSFLTRLSPVALEVFRQKRGIPQLIQAADDKDIRFHRSVRQQLRICSANLLSSRLECCSALTERFPEI